MSIQTIALYQPHAQLGDALVVVPFLAELRQRFPHAHITWIGKKDNMFNTALRELVAPYLDEVLIRPEFGEKLGLWQSLKFILSPPPVAEELHFDVVLFEHASFLRAVANKRRFKTPLFLCRSVGWLLSDVRPALRQRFGQKHHFESFRNSLNLIAPPVSGALPPLPIERFRKKAAELLPDTKRYVGFVPGSGELDNRRWPLDNFLVLAHQSVAAGYSPVFFIGPNEKEMRDIIAQSLPAISPEILFPEEGGGDMSGPLLAIALAEHLACGVANDSGGGHILATANIPLINLCGKYDPARWRPICDDLTIFWAKNYNRNGDMAAIPLADVAACLANKL